MGYEDYKLPHQVELEVGQLPQDEVQEALHEVHGEESFEVHGEEQFGVCSRVDRDLDFLGYEDDELPNQVKHEEDQLLQDDGREVLQEVHGEETFEVHGEEQVGVCTGAGVSGYLSYWDQELPHQGGLEQDEVLQDYEDYIQGVHGGGNRGTYGEDDDDWEQWRSSGRGAETGISKEGERIPSEQEDRLEQLHHPEEVHVVGAKGDPHAEGRQSRRHQPRRWRKRAGGVRGVNKGVGDEQLHHAKEVHVAGDGDQPKPTEVYPRGHQGQRPGEETLKAGGPLGARRPPRPSPTQPGPGRVERLLEELELDQCDYLDQPSRLEQVKELVREYQDIFTGEGKKVGMVPSRYCTTIKLKQGLCP